MDQDSFPPDRTIFHDTATTLEVSRPQTFFEQMKLAVRRFRLTGNGSTTTKIGVIYSSQMFAKHARIEPMRYEKCLRCARTLAHTYWSDGSYRCIRCVHQGKSVTLDICPGHGPSVHVIRSDGGYQCYRCWLFVAKTHLANLKEEPVAAEEPARRLHLAR